MFTWKEEVKEASSRRLPHRQTPLLWHLYTSTTLPQNFETHEYQPGGSAWPAHGVKMISIRSHVMSATLTGKP